MHISIKYVIIAIICCFKLVKAQESQGIRFTSPRNETLRTIHAPAVPCAIIAPPQASGVLISYEALRKQLIYGDRIDNAMQVLASNSVVLITSTNIADGNLVPFHNDTKKNFLTMEKVKSWNPQGIIVRNTLARDGGHSQWIYTSREWCYTMNMTYLEVGYHDGFTLEAMEHIQMVLQMVSNTSFTSPDVYHLVLTQGDVSKWQILRRSGFMVFWRFFMSLLSGITATISLYKLMVYIKVHGIQLTVPQLTLMILIVVSLLRCTYTAVDPLFLGYTDMLGNQAHMLISIHLPAFPITALLLALYWKEVMDSSKVNASGFLSKMKIPFIIASVITLLVEFVSSSLRAAEITATGIAVFITGIIDIGIVGSTSIFFVVMGVRIIRRLESTAVAANVTSSSRTRETLRRTTILIMTTAIFGLCFVIGLLLIVSDEWAWTMIGFIVSWSFIYLGLFGGAFVQALAIRTPDLITSPSNSGNFPAAKMPPTV